MENVMSSSEFIYSFGFSVMVAVLGYAIAVIPFTLSIPKSWNAKKWGFWLLASEPLSMLGVCVWLFILNYPLSSELRIFVLVLLFIPGPIASNLILSMSETKLGVHTAELQSARKKGVGVTAGWLLLFFIVLIIFLLYS